MPSNSTPVNLSGEIHNGSMCPLRRPQLHTLYTFAAIVGGVALATWLYSPSFRAPFYNDDYVFLGQLFQYGPWESLRIATGRHFMPAYRLAVAVQASLFGRQPWGYHVSGVALHMVNALLVGWLALRLTGSRAAAFAGGLMFGFCPTIARFVSWSTCLAWSLTMACALATSHLLLNSTRFTDPNRTTHPRAWQSLAAGAFFAGLGFHSAGWVIAPVALLLLWSARRPIAPAALALAVAAGLFLVFQGTFKIVTHGDIFSFSDVRTWKRTAAFAPQFVSAIAEETARPFRVYPDLRFGLGWAPPIAGAVLMLGAATALARRRLAWVGAAVYAGCWLGVVAVRPLTFLSVAYRYFPLLGLALLVAAAAASPQPLRSSQRGWIMVVALAMALPAWFVSTRDEIRAFEARSRKIAALVESYRTSMHAFLVERPRSVSPVVVRNDAVTPGIYKEPLFHFLFPGVEGVEFAPTKKLAVTHWWAPQSVLDRAALSRHLNSRAR